MLLHRTYTAAIVYTHTHTLYMLCMMYISIVSTQITQMTQILLKQYTFKKRMTGEYTCRVLICYGTLETHTFVPIVCVCVCVGQRKLSSLSLLTECGHAAGPSGEEQSGYIEANSSAFRLRG